MKLLVETTEEFDVLTEENENGEKNMFIEGIFMQAEKVNRNGRIYPRKVMEREVNRFVNEQVLKNTAGGELGHPEGPQVNLDRVSHRITELRMEGNNVVGKALLLDTPTGMTAKNLIKGGFRLGVSSRALGSVKESNDERGGRKVKVVQPDFKLFAVDIVGDPSAPDAMVDAITENTEWVNEDGVWKPIPLKESRVDPYEVSLAKRKSYYDLFRKL